MARRHGGAAADAVGPGLVPPLYAGMVIVIVPVLIVYALIQRRLIEGMASGGVKG